MKLYEKEIEGKLVRKTRTQIIVKKDGLQIINPSEEVILADGWVEYVKPEPTAEELLERAKRAKKAEITAYDSSSAVNEFTIQGMSVWLDKATRAGLMLRFQAEQATGAENTTLWYGGVQFPLPLVNAVAMLYAIECYASACYDNTQKHLASVDALATIEEVEAYDYKQGYPEKLKF